MFCFRILAFDMQIDVDWYSCASLQRNWSKKMQPLWIPPGKAAPIFNSLKSMIVFFWEFVLCSNLRFNLFIITTFGSNSIVWLACGIQLCQIQSVHWGKKYLEHDVWITPRNIIYLASYGIFLTAIFLIPFIYLVKELFAFSYILSQQ